MCALLIQIATNLANDYFDYVKGADTTERIGPVRVVQSGLLEPATVRNAMIGVLVLAFVLGLYLVYRGGLPILVIGVISIFFAVGYTAGPMPLAYVGLGDVFVFLFFGVVAVTGTYYVQALQWSGGAFIASLPVGAIATAILVVNNYRDLDTDRIAGKKTLAVRFGRAVARGEYAGLIAFAYVVVLAQTFFGHVEFRFLFAMLSVPFAYRVLSVVMKRTDGPSLNNALAATGRLLAIFGLLYSIGLIIKRVFP